MAPRAPDQCVPEVENIIGEVQWQVVVRPKAKGEIVQDYVGNIWRERMGEGAVAQVTEAEIVQQIMGEYMGVASAEVADKTLQRTAEAAQSPPQTADRG